MRVPFLDRSVWHAGEGVKQMQCFVRTSGLQNVGYQKSCTATIHTALSEVTLQVRTMATQPINNVAPVRCHQCTIANLIIYSRLELRLGPWSKCIRSGLYSVSEMVQSILNNLLSCVFHAGLFSQVVYYSGSQCSWVVPLKDTVG